MSERRRRHSSSTDPGPNGFASTSSATRSCPSYEGSSRRLGYASHECSVSALAIRQGASGRQPHLFWRPRNRLTNGSQFRSTTLFGSERSFRFFELSPSTKV